MEKEERLNENKREAETDGGTGKRIKREANSREKDRRTREDMKKGRKRGHKGIT